jgi:stage II sporulation protein D
MLVVNELDLESYLGGVLAAEMPLYFPEESLKAQLIACRTYALHRMLNAGDAHYDLKPDVRSQVYQGLDGECPLSRKLVALTRGLVLVYDWHLFAGYYHSCCGGHTTSPATAWDEKTIFPLSGVACGYCSGSEYANWKVELSGEELLAALRQTGASLDAISTVRPVAVDSSGYVRTLVLDDGGAPVDVNANELRRWLGWRRLPSTAFSVARQAGGFVFSGRGFGHGVGMCQWGAKGMAEQGADATQILQHYYPGSRVVRLGY